MDSKKLARLLQTAAKKFNYDIKLTHAQEIVAQMNGFDNRHAQFDSEKNKIVYGNVRLSEEDLDMYNAKIKLSTMIDLPVYDLLKEKEKTNPDIFNQILFDSVSREVYFKVKTFSTVLDQHILIVFKKTIATSKEALPKDRMISVARSMGFKNAGINHYEEITEDQYDSLRDQGAVTIERFVEHQSKAEKLNKEFYFVMFIIYGPAQNVLLFKKNLPFNDDEPMTQKRMASLAYNLGCKGLFESKDEAEFIEKHQTLFREENVTSYEKRKEEKVRYNRLYEVYEDKQGESNEQS